MKTSLIRVLALIAGTALLVTACKPAAKQPGGSPSAKPMASAAAPASPKFTFSNFPVPPEPPVTPEFMERGKFVYQQNCVACHGANGDGKGDAAAFLNPKPRNFAEANFRLRSTASGKLPTDGDLFRSVSMGMPGTPMPPWRFILSDADRWALVEYIKSFSPRFADTNEDRRPIVGFTVPAPRNGETLAEGKALFTKMACITCHGEGGRGDGTSAPGLTDDSHSPIKPRDFSRPVAFKSGYSTREIVRTILTGFNGTPMAGFHGTIAESNAWKLAYYVETFAKPAPSTAIVRASQNFLEREPLGEPDMRIKLTERAWHYDPNVIHVKKGQIVEITFEPTDNGLGVGHGFGISGYDEDVFINGAMVGAPKTVKFRASRAGKFTYYCATQCSTEKLHPQMNGTLIVEDAAPKQTASLQ